MAPPRAISTARVCCVVFLLMERSTARVTEGSATTARPVSLAQVSDMAGSLSQHYHEAGRASGLRGTGDLDPSARTPELEGTKDHPEVGTASRVARLSQPHVPSAVSDAYNERRRRNNGERGDGVGQEAIGEDSEVSDTIDGGDSFSRRSTFSSAEAPTSTTRAEEASSPAGSFSEGAVETPDKWAMEWIPIPRRIADHCADQLPVTVYQALMKLDAHTGESHGVWGINVHLHGTWGRYRPPEVEALIGDGTLSFEAWRREEAGGYGTGGENKGREEDDPGGPDSFATETETSGHREKMKVMPFVWDPPPTADRTQREEAETDGGPAQIELELKCPPGSVVCIVSGELAALTRRAYRAHTAGGRHDQGAPGLMKDFNEEGLDNPVVSIEGVLWSPLPFPGLEGDEYPSALHGLGGIAEGAPVPYGKICALGMRARNIGNIDGPSRWPSTIQGGMVVRLLAGYQPRLMHQRQLASEGLNHVPGVMVGLVEALVPRNATAPPSQAGATDRLFLEQGQDPMGLLRDPSTSPLWLVFNRSVSKFGAPGAHGYRLTRLREIPRVKKQAPKVPQVVPSWQQQRLHLHGCRNLLVYLVSLACRSESVLLSGFLASWAIGAGDPPVGEVHGEASPPATSKGSISFDFLGLGEVTGKCFTPLYWNQELLLLPACEGSSVSERRPLIEEEGGSRQVDGEDPVGEDALAQAEAELRPLAVVVLASLSGWGDGSAASSAYLGGQSTSCSGSVGSSQNISIAAEGLYDPMSREMTLIGCWSMQVGAAPHQHSHAATEGPSAGGKPLPASPSSPCPSPAPFPFPHCGLGISFWLPADSESSDTALSPVKGYLWAYHGDAARNGGQRQPYLEIEEVGEYLNLQKPYSVLDAVDGTNAISLLYAIGSSSALGTSILCLLLLLQIRHTLKHPALGRHITYPTLLHVVVGSACYILLLFLEATADGSYWDNADLRYTSRLTLLSGIVRQEPWGYIIQGPVVPVEEKRWAPWRGRGGAAAEILMPLVVLELVLAVRLLVAVRAARKRGVGGPGGSRGGYTELVELLRARDEQAEAADAGMLAQGEAKTHTLGEAQGHGERQGQGQAQAQVQDSCVLEPRGVLRRKAGVPRGHYAQANPELTELFLPKYVGAVLEVRREQQQHHQHPQQHQQQEEEEEQKQQAMELDDQKEIRTEIGTTTADKMEAGREGIQPGQGTGPNQGLSLRDSGDISFSASHCLMYQLVAKFSAQALILPWLYAALAVMYLMAYVGVSWMPLLLVQSCAGPYFLLPQLVAIADNRTCARAFHPWFPVGMTAVYALSALNNDTTSDAVRSLAVLAMFKLLK